MSRPNSAQRAAIQRGDPFAAGFAALRDFSEEITDANAAPIKDAAAALVKGIKGVVAAKGGTSAPGSPPHRHSSRLFRSIGTEVVDDVRRVGSGYFVAEIQEVGLASKKHTIEPRPFMAKGLNAATPEMTESLVGALRKKPMKGAING